MVDCSGSIIYLPVEPNTMKILILTSALLVANADAIQLKDLVGEWAGTRKETVNGVGAATKVTVKSVIKSGGVATVVKGNSTLIGPFVANEIFSKDGKFSESITASGFIVASNKGTWKIKNGLIEIRSSGGSLSGNVTIRGTVQTFGKNQIKYQGTSNSAKVSYDVRRQ